ncbi:hypothetical protein DID88_008002 [Monilinia fructigena]|uniref:cAMP-dependent protein kinase n=1 Tax=Monilinia fructigena TaxID=38457 RepID=A0A395J4Z5_9HELO|nr:hypothetical protein DID88_008002 [Monilinia fructigena]
MPPRRTSRGVGGGYDNPAHPASAANKHYDTEGNVVTAEEWKVRGAAVGVREEIGADGKVHLKQHCVIRDGPPDPYRSCRKDLGQEAYNQGEKDQVCEYRERHSESTIRPPGIIRLFFTFQDSACLYYVLEYASGGELLGVLKKIGSFDEECTRFYGAQLLEAIDINAPEGNCGFGVRVSERISPRARDLVERLLVLDPQRRLSIEHIKNHEFFSGIRFSRELWKVKAPRLKPLCPTDAGTYSDQPQWLFERAATFSDIKRTATTCFIQWSIKCPNTKNGEEVPERKGGFARFFGGSTTKKRARLVMVTSSARIILAAAGGDEKKTKTDISLLASDCSWRVQLDAKGAICVRGTHYTFEDTKTSATSNDPSKTSAQEWIEAIEKAKDMALSQSMVGSYSSDTGFDMPSTATSPSSTIHGTSIYQDNYGHSDRSGRHHLTKSQASLGGEDGLGDTRRKTHRFSKRQSKNGLSTPF